MNIYYIANIRMPTEKAHGYQIAKMCEAFAYNRCDVSLIVPMRRNNIKEDIPNYYGVRNNFFVHHIPTFDALTFFGGSRLGFYAQAVSFLLTLRKIAIPRDAVIITRNPEIAWWYGRTGRRVFYDAHNFPTRGRRLLKWFLGNVSGIIANSNGTAEAFRKLEFANILVAPNAVDLSEFDNAIPADRKKSGLPTGRIVMYVGHLYSWKGIDIVVEAARRFKNSNTTFVFIGGTDSDLDAYKDKTKDLGNVLFLGRRPHIEIPYLMKSADVLLLPNVAISDESKFYTSPIKMFEYMASGVPIVASNLPSIREILDDANSILVRAGDSIELTKGIEQAFSTGKFLAKKALSDVRRYTWSVRAEKVQVFLEK